MKGRKGGVDEEGSGHRVWGKRAKVRQRGKMQRWCGERDSGSECRKRAA